VRISFFGHFGTSNTGNEATLLATLSRLRAVYPDGEFRCICTYPAEAAAWYGIAAVPITTRRASLRNREARPARRLVSAFVAGAEELWQYVRAFHALRGTDIFVVPGTGLITDAYGLHGWGPYNLFKWTLMARAAGCRVIYLSVGAGPIDTSAGRLLARSALSLAHYRSYRDHSSRVWLERIGFRTVGDRVYPDLAFGLPGELVPARATAERETRVVGLGLMLDAGKYRVRDPVPETYDLYLDALVAFVEWLLARDYEVRLFLGDEDVAAVDDFGLVLRDRLGSYDERRVSYRATDSPRDILRELSELDALVATRFHNVLLAFVAGTPAVAISFHHKCTSLMEEMGLAAYCHDINRMDAGRLIAQFEALEEDAEQVKAAIRHRVGELRSALDEQYELLFDARSPAAGTESATEVAA
jgi:polysaccharide pyruvyl transferase WcaK-like protein